MSCQAQAGKRQLSTQRSALQQRAMANTVPALVAVEDSEADVAVVDCRQRVAGQGAKRPVACTAPAVPGSQSTADKQSRST